MDIKGTLLFRLTIIILSIVIASMVGFSRALLKVPFLSNRNGVQPTFTQVHRLCLINKKKRYLLFPRCHLASICEVTKATSSFSDFAFPSTVKPAESRIKSALLDSPKGTLLFSYPCTSCIGTIFVKRRCLKNGSHPKTEFSN